MSREDAKKILFGIINSGIISEELEDKLNEMCNRLCNDDWDECEGSIYCEGCRHENH